MKMGKSIFLFSRGQGTAHACRDMILADSLSELDDSVEIKFVSYGEGYKTLSVLGWPCINIGIPFKEDEHDRLLKMGQALREEKPDLVISDEELLALPLAKIFQIPSLLITNWFPPAPNHPTMSYFADPQEIIVPDLTDSFGAPSEIKSPVHFVGPILRPIDSNLAERKKFREEFGITPEEKLILVTAGEAESNDVDFFQRCIEVFKRLKLNAKLIAVVGELKEELEGDMKADGRISLREYLWQLDRYMLASDLVIHRGGYFTLWELASVGMPSICVPRLTGDFRVQNLSYAKKMEQYGASVVVKEERMEEELVEQMKAILTSQERWDEMSQAGLRICQGSGERRAAKVVLSSLGNGVAQKCHV